MPREQTAITSERQAIASALAAAREKSGLSQVQAAAALKVTQPTITYWESGSRCPPLTKFAEIAAAYKVAPMTLLRKIFENFPEKT